GVKTGRSSRAGDCLILYANRESEVVRNGQMETVYPRHLMVVLLGSTNRFGEGVALMQRGWQLYDQWAAAGRMADPQKILYFRYCENETAHWCFDQRWRLSGA